MQTPIKILVTGERDGVGAFPTALPDGTPIEWSTLPVLAFERLPVAPDLVERLILKPAEWAIFTSSRSVQFWTEELLAAGWDFPLETRVACIGSRTADAAAEVGLTPDFVPARPGTEGFLAEFEPMIKRKPVRPTVFLPMAEGGRPTLEARLKKLGCEVLRLPLYRTRTLEDLSERMTQERLNSYTLILFTSPSSVDALMHNFALTPEVSLAAIGTFTADYLQNQGLGARKVLPDGDFARIAEVL